MSEKLFGTDGIRAVAGQWPLVKDFVRGIGYAAAKEILKNRRAKGRPLAIIGRDSRKSGLGISRWLEEGLSAAGVRVLDAGVVPTPGVSYIVLAEKAAFGVVVSASHNTEEFNGIKFFGPDGMKLSEKLEGAIEASLARCVPAIVPTAAHKALVRRSPRLAEEYADFIVSTMPKGVSLKGLRLVVDCANGAAYRIGPRIFRRLGAKVAAIGCKPDGRNINEGCGSLHTGLMRKAVIDTGADCGLSLDGDADRVLLSDENGRELDGDDLIVMAAHALRGQGRLSGGKVAVTVMSNFGLFKNFEANGIKTARTAVGDKYVSDALVKGGLVLGGESSGHIIFREFAPTGDGLLTAVQMLGLWRQRGGRLSEFASLWHRYPQELRAVKVERKVPLDKIPGFNRRVAELEKKLGADGRIFIRYSGTEPKLRILVEGPDAPTVSGIAQELADYFKSKAEEAICL